MSAFILILFAHVGSLGNGNSNALTTVNNFKTIEACIEAGKQAKELSSGSTQIKFTCVRSG